MEAARQHLSNITTFKNNRNRKTGGKKTADERKWAIGMKWVRGVTMEEGELWWQSPSHTWTEGKAAKRHWDHLNWELEKDDGGGAQVSARIQRSLSHNKIKVTWTPARQQIGFEKNETINSCACAKTLMHQKHPCCFRRAEQCQVDFCQLFHFSWGVFKERARF